MDKSTERTWQNVTLLIVRLMVAALFLSAAWMKFTSWDATMNFLTSTGTSIGLPAWFASLYAFLVPFVEAFIGLSFLTGWCGKISGAALFLLVLSFWIVMSAAPEYVGALKDFHVYLMVLGLVTFSFGTGDYRLLKCNFKCCKE